VLRAALWRDPELLIAGQRTTGGAHRHKAGGRPARNHGLQEGVGHYGEGCGCSVETDAGRAGQPTAQNPYGFPNLARRGQGFDKRPQADIKAEKNTPVMSPSRVRQPVNLAVGVLHGVYEFAP
jgi:hypothetical protein